MKKNKLGVNITVDQEEGEVRITLSDEDKNKIPRPGDSIYLVSPYPIVDKGDVDDDEILESDVKENLPLSYSYTGVVAKVVALNDECDAVKVNGEYDIPLRNNGDNPRRKLLIFTSESEARDKFRTLMSASLKEANRRLTLAENIKSYLEEALEKMHH